MTPRTILDVAGVRSRLTEYVARRGWRGTADDFGVTESYVRMVSAGRATPGPSILKGLGLTKAFVTTEEES